MKYSEFLKQLRTKMNAKNTADLYRMLGGEEKLGISLRHFQSVENGTRTPPECLFMSLFRTISPSDKKAYVISFMTSLLENTDSSDLLSYLEKYLSPEIERKQQSVWDSKNSSYLTDEQMAFLIDNPDCFKFHKKLLMQEKVPLASIALKKQKIDDMKRLELIKVVGKYMIPYSIVCRLPTTETHGPKSVSIASNYILKHLDFFLSREGEDSQSLGYGFQMVTTSNARRIHEQVLSLKKWIQSLASKPEAHEPLVPLLFVGFSKTVTWKEID